MIIETQILACFENGLSGTFSIDSDFEQISFIPHIEDGEWVVSVDYFMGTGNDSILDILDNFNNTLKTDVTSQDFMPIASLLARILGDE